MNIEKSKEMEEESLIIQGERFKVLGTVKKPKDRHYVILSEAKNLRISISHHDEILRPAFGEAQNGNNVQKVLHKPYSSCF
jgi:hypothetical protein